MAPLFSAFISTEKLDNETVKAVTCDMAEISRRPACLKTTERVSVGTGFSFFIK